MERTLSPQRKMELRDQALLKIKIEEKHLKEEAYREKQQKYAEDQYFEPTMFEEE